MSNDQVTTEPLGQFQVVSGTLTISDPCYAAEGVRGRGELADVRLGSWDAHVVYKDCGDWGTRAAVLIAKNTAEEIAHDDKRWSLTAIEVGVDSGQAGIFDKQHYKDNAVAEGQPQAEYIKDNPWYAMCCAMTSEGRQAGVIPFGVVSSSGYGDGVYDCYTIKEAGIIVAVKLDFGVLDKDEELYDDDEEDEDEDEDDEDDDEDDEDDDEDDEDDF